MSFEFSELNLNPKPGHGPELDNNSTTKPDSIVFRSIYETTCRLQRLMEIYQDRICFLAGEENGLGRFLKEHGKSDKTRAGKMMVAAGKTMSYTGQQRLAIR